MDCKLEYICRYYASVALGVAACARLFTIYLIEQAASSGAWCVLLVVHETRMKVREAESAGQGNGPMDACPWPQWSARHCAESTISSRTASLISFPLRE